MLTRKQFARALKQLDISATELAVQLGVQRSAVYHWLAGRRRIPGPVVAAITCWLERKQEWHAHERR